MRKIRLFYIIALLIPFVIFINPAWAGGLGTRFTKVVLEDLKIGCSYSIAEVKGETLVVENTGERTTDLKVEAVKPFEQELEEDYEAIPDISWVKILKDFFTIEPGGKARTDIILSIPDDKRYSGKRYQVMIWSRGVGGGIGVGLKSRLLFNISENKGANPSLGLSVMPATYLFSDLPLGERIELKIPLKIKNMSDEPQTYILSTYRAEELKRKPVEGYQEIPHPDWVEFEENEIVVEPNQISSVKMYIKVPNEERYYNQHWQIDLGVTMKPRSGERLALAAYPRYFIETESRDDLVELPAGAIGLIPSNIILKDIPLGLTEKVAEVKIYNNDNITHSYQISSEVPFPDSKRKIPLSFGYRWMPDSKWVVPNRSKLKINPGRSKIIFLGLNIPRKSESLGRRWEGLLFIRPDEGLPGFVRVQVTTIKK